MVRVILSLVVAVVLPAAVGSSPGTEQALQPGTNGPVDGDARALAAIQAKLKKVEYAMNDEMAAKAAADEAYSRMERDKILFHKDGISTLELSASYSAKERFFCNYIAKGTVVKLAHHDLQQARTLFIMNAREKNGELAPGSIELFKALTALREKELDLEYASFNRNAARAATDEAASYLECDRRMYDKNCITVSQFGSSLLALQTRRCDCLIKGFAMEIARNELNRARIDCAQHLLYAVWPLRLGQH